MKKKEKVKSRNNVRYSHNRWVFRFCLNESMGPTVRYYWTATQQANLRYV